MNTDFILIEPHYSDPDTFCTFTAGNSVCRASLKIYADMDELQEVVHALNNSLDGPHPLVDFTIADRNCMDLSFYRDPDTIRKNTASDQGR